MATSTAEFDGKADIGGVQRRGIVDPIAEIADHMALPPQRGDDAGLLRRGDAAKYVRFVELGQQRLVRQASELRAVEYASDGDTKLAADMPGYLLIVPGYDF